MGGDVMVQGLSAGFRFQRNELLLLAAMHGADRLPGLGDVEHLADADAEVLAGHWRSMRASLCDKGFMPLEEMAGRLPTGSPVELDGAILLVLETLFHPDSTLVMSGTKAFQSMPVRILVRREKRLAVLQEELSSDGGYVLIPCEDEQALFTVLDLEPPEPEPSEAGTCGMGMSLDGAMARKAANSLQNADMATARRVFAEAGFTEAEALDAAASLLEKRTHLCLEQHQAGLREIILLLVEGREVLWEVTSDSLGRHGSAEPSGVSFIVRCPEQMDSLAAEKISRWMRGNEG